MTDATVRKAELYRMDAFEAEHQVPRHKLSSMVSAPAAMTNCASMWARR